MPTMAHRSGHTLPLLVLLILTSLAGPRDASAVSPPQSLDRCQKIVSDEGTQFVTELQRAIGKCFKRISDELVRKGKSSVDPAVRTCASAFEEILSDDGGPGTRARLESNVRQWCSPGRPGVTHTLGDLLGPGANVDQPLDVGNLGAWCATHGGDGSVSSVDEWLDCLVEAHWSAAATAVTSEFPSALEWLALIRPSLEADPGSANALAALDALANEIGVIPLSGLPATGQTISYAPLDDGEVRAGAVLLLTDNGDGTISDENTGLTWEKKSDDGGLHDKDRAFVWDPGAGSIWEWLAAVNAEDFGGHDDWRIPNKKELESIVDAGRFNPAFPAAFETGCAPGCAAVLCSCTGTLLHYWTSSSVAAAPTTFAWSLLPSSGAVLASNRKTLVGHVRAVRGP